MKILHIHTSLAGGGVEAMIVSLANQMSLNHTVTVCTILSPKETDVFLHKLRPSVQFISLNKKKPGVSVKELFQIYSLIKKEKYDVVHMHGFIYYYAIAIFFLFKKVRFIYTLHTNPLKENKGWSKRFMCFKRWAFKNKKVIPVVISDDSARTFFEMYGIKAEYVPNGIERPKLKTQSFEIVNKYKITKETKIFFHPGIISVPKNQIVLCRVFRRLIEKYDVVLLIAGARQDENIYAEISSMLCERIVYLGERDDIPSLLAKSDAMCLPSIWEGLPVTLLESLSVGCIPICSDVGGIPDVVRNGFNGLLSKGYNEDDYFKTMINFLSMDDKKRLEMKRICYKSFENYEIEECVTKYYYLYSNKYNT